MQIKKILKFILVTVGVITLSTVVFAATDFSKMTTPLDPDLKPGYLPNFAMDNNGSTQTAIAFPSFILQLLSGALLYFAGPISILLIAVGGLMYVTSRGDDNMMSKAKNTITYALIGLVVIIVSFVAVRGVIQVVFEADKLSNPNTTQSQPKTPENPTPPNNNTSNTPKASEFTPGGGEVP